MSYPDNPYLRLLSAVFQDSYEEFGVETDLDLLYVDLGFKDKGLEFLTLDLPKLDALLLQSLELGELSAEWPTLGSVLFLDGILSHVFDLSQERKPLSLSDDVFEQSRAIRAVRQICLLFSKVKVLPSPDKIVEAIDGWFDIEETLKDQRTLIRSALSPAFLAHVNRLYGRMFQRIEHRLKSGDIPWAHGPGAVAESGIYGVEKYSQLFPNWTARADKVASRWSATLINYGEYVDRELDDDLPLVSPRSEHNMRVTVVPKTAKSPRIIAMEPTVNQWGQQALMRLFTEELSHSPRLSAVNWTDQTRNQQLAYEGSLYGLATLDLSEASDRLSLQVVAAMLPPYLRKWVFAFRSTRASFEDRAVQLEKFAPMGSAMCFVMESLAFYAIATFAQNRAKAANLPPGSPIKQPECSVYGDDIIVESEYAPSVIAMLEAFGLRVNLNKSFWRGNFRESCGADYWHGYDVSVVRVRHLIDNAPSPDAMVSLVSTQNFLFLRGLERSAQVLRDFWPFVPAHQVPVEQGYAFLSSYEEGEIRWSSALWRMEYKAISLKLRVRQSNGWNALRTWYDSARLRRRASDHAQQYLVSRPQPVGLRYHYAPRERSVDGQ
jgi:hypothetical protein